MKRCCECGVTKDKTEFSKDVKNTDNLSRSCRSCCKARHARYYSKHREKLIADTLKWRQAHPGSHNQASKRYYKKHKDRYYELNRVTRLRKLGMTLEDYARLFSEQGGKCAICRTADTGVKKNNFPVDHDHKTGKVRGLLCDRCNTSLGQFEDNPDLLRKAADYLEGKLVNG